MTSHEFILCTDIHHRELLTFYDIFDFHIAGFYFSSLNNKPPISAPYSVLFNGLDVIAQVPEEHPTK